MSAPLGEVQGNGEGRPHPLPEHSLAPRRPRTIGGAVYLAVLLTTALGLGMVALGQWRAGLTVMGGAMLFASLARLVIPDRNAGMLGIRRKAVDVFTLLGLGAAVVVLAAIIPTRGPL